MQFPAAKSKLFFLSCKFEEIFPFFQIHLMAIRHRFFEIHQLIKSPFDWLFILLHNLHPDKVGK